MSNGMMNTTELLDSLIVDCDCAVKDLISHGYIGFCAHMVAIVQKLGALKAGCHWARFPYAVAAAMLKTDTPFLNR